MPRIARISIPDIPVHITQRGNYRQNIFSDDIDKEFYLKAFIHFKEKFKVKMFTWCLIERPYFYK